MTSKRKNPQLDRIIATPEVSIVGLALAPARVAIGTTDGLYQSPVAETSEGHSSSVRCQVLSGL